MLEIKNLTVEASGKEIFRDVNFTIPRGEVMVLFGPNGSGKSTLIKTIMGLSGFQVTQGEIVFHNKEIHTLPVEERVKMGIGVMYQHPPKIRGVTLTQLADFLCSQKEKVIGLADQLSLNQHLSRDINVDFSGGEMKRSELFQVLLQDPDLLLLDEPESGVDIENISLMGKVLNGYLTRPDKSALIITHTGYILEYIGAKTGCMLLNGGFWCIGSPKEMFTNIKEHGYEKCKECTWLRKH